MIRLKMYRIGKRYFDLIVALLAFILLLPVILFIAVVILLVDGTPVIYKQTRVGENWKAFSILKFRTMVNNSNISEPAVTVKDDHRITKTGKFLRKFKLDELPQLVNVIKGDMSLIGPRPELYQYVNHYKEEYKEILKVKPGITDYASVMFRDEAALLISAKDADHVYLSVILPQKLFLNKRYIKEQSFITDIKIIFMTLSSLYFGKKRF